MARRLTTGDMCVLGVIDETTFNEPSSAIAYAGTLSRLSDKTALMTEDVVECGSRIVTRQETGFTTGFSATFRVLRPSEDCIRGWLTRALGGTSPSHELPSFTAKAKVGPTTYAAWTGSMVDTLTISQPAVGSAIQVQVDAVSAYAGKGTIGGGTFEGPLGSIGKVPATMAVSPGGALEVRGSVEVYMSETLIPLGVKAWTLSISNSLESVPGIVSDETSGAGGGMFPTACDITAELTFSAIESEELDTIRRMKAYPPRVEITIGEVKVVLSNLTVEPAQPDRTSESAYDDTLRVRAKTIEVV